MGIAPAKERPCPTYRYPDMLQCAAPTAQLMSESLISLSIMAARITTIEVVAECTLGVQRNGALLTQRPTYFVLTAANLTP